MEGAGGSVIAWISILLLMSGMQLALGVGLGARLRGRRRDGPDPEAHQAYLRELQSVATRVAEQVSQHSQRVDAIQEELAGAATQTGAEREASLAKATHQMLDATEQLKVELAAARGELAQQTQKLAQQTQEARTDALTCLANRRAFDEEMQRRFAQFRRQHGALSMLLIDVDHFKKFNDTHGHRAGDEVLKQVARTLATTMRDMDIVARYGGEEFAVVLPGTNLANGKIAAERARAAIEAAIVAHGDAELRVSASVGLAQAMPGDDPQSLIERADQALYAAKGGGRNQAWYHNGRESLAVEAAQPAPPPAEVEMTVEQLVLAPQPQPQSQPVDPPTGNPADRRRHPRSPMRARQFIAPFIKGQIPKSSMFSEVQCEDVSASGFSYYADEPPGGSDLIVEFGVSPNLMYLSAQVVHCTPIGTAQVPRYRVGCRFNGRLRM